MRSYVLVHGGNMSVDTWNRLTIDDPVHTEDGRMGGLIWDPVIPALAEGDGRVFAPTLGHEHVDNLAANLAQVTAIIEDNNLDGIVLAGHSFGGMVITGVAARFPDRIRGIVCVDAALPDPGQSLFDIIRVGGRDPLSFEGLEAAPPYVERLDFDAGLLEPLPKTYVLCTESEFAPVTEVAKKRIAEAETRGAGNWTYIELPTWHVPMATMPDRVAAIIRAV